MGRSTDYSKCYIYHIVDKEGIVHYVGSTSNFNSRKSRHKYNCNTEKDAHHNLDIYKYIRDNGNWGAFDMVPIQKIENISNKTELRIAENDEMKKFTGLKNMIGSYRTLQQKIESSRIWKENNPEKNKEGKRIWKENNPEKYIESHRKASLRYYENNRERLLEARRQKYQEKKELKSDQ
tara:strand:+ start:85 stop:621 length:537 start_codon:yes stop_codon:yes gene_type:complete